MKIVLPGGAGLVGQNLVVRLRARGHEDIVVIDKHERNLAVLQQLHPEVRAICADLAEPGPWMESLAGADALVMLQAQIGGTRYEDFQRNNVEATRWILQAFQDHGVSRLVHISSSVVQSVADDFYTRSKKEQEQLVLASGIACPILRPTLMFGWFDRKHLGWLSRFMQRVPLFPIPGDGRFMRQPLYVGDFCEVIIRCVEQTGFNGVHNISGHEQIDYIDLIREIRRATRSRTPIVRIPYGLFNALLATWALFDRNPPFTTQQLAALVAGDKFEVTDWPGTFGVNCTTVRQAIDETFNDPRYASVALEF
jgi:nucleoside-diphosphate-sugar epimerase